MVALKGMSPQISWNSPDGFEKPDVKQINVVGVWSMSIVLLALYHSVARARRKLGKPQSGKSRPPSLSVVSNALELFRRIRWLLVV